MMTSDTPTNRKLADQLHDVRQRISDLRDQEEQLRRGLITGALDPAGEEFVVTIETKINERVDLAVMRKHVAERIWKPYAVEKAITYVNVRRKQRATRCRLLRPRNERANLNQERRTPT